MAQGTVWGAIALGLAVALGGCGTSAEQQSQEGEPQVVVGGTQPADQADGAPAVLTVARGKDSDFPIVQPIRCTLGKDCFVLLYPDRDPSSNAKDFTCGQLTYDGHKGTDFAIDSWTPETDVPVLASAPGTVLAVRDGVRDYRIASPDEFATVKGIECGNGILMAHDDGWTTQYCHLERGSVSVRQGDRLDAGDPIGMVGLSGKTTFPHVHLTVRHNNKVVDPFVGKGSESGCDIPVRSPLWSQPDVNYVPTGLIRSGFSDGAVEEAGSTGTGVSGFPAPAPPSYSGPTPTECRPGIKNWWNLGIPAEKSWPTSKNPCKIVAGFISDISAKRPAMVPSLRALGRGVSA